MELLGLTSDPVATSIGWLWGLTLGGIALGLGTSLLERVRVRVRGPRRPRPGALHPFVPRCLSFLGIAVAISSGSAVAGTRTPVSPHRRASDAAPPWSEAGGFPPPRPLARAEVAETDGDRGDRAHPALHRGPSARPETASAPTPLFPRTGSHGDAELEERRAAMRRHPSGRTQGCKHHVVKRGDSLWSIAEQALGTDEPRAVARYWPRLHRANRATIGPDPRLILPGQVLELPSCD